MAPELSVVVCSHNGARKLPIALTSLGTQGAPHDSFEVIVVDDGSTDDTAEVAKCHGVRVVRIGHNVGLAAARNAGISAAAGEIVAFTDDDCQVAPSWVTTLIDAFRDSSVDAVGGRVVPDATRPFMRGFLRFFNPLTPLGAELLVSNSLGYRLKLYLRRLLGPRAELGPLFSVVGANMAFRRDQLCAVGGFDEAFRFGAEEEDLCRRLHARTGGATIRYVADAVVTHWFDDKIGDSLRRARAYGRGNARSVLKHADMRPIVYPIPFIVALCLLAALTSRRPRLLAFAVLAPLAAYPRWLSSAYTQRSATPAAFPYLQLAQEISGMIGQIEGLRAGYEPVPAAHLTEKPSVASASD